MTIIELKDQIIKHTLKNFYIFVGEEIGIINIYLNQMSKVLGLPIVRMDSVQSAFSRSTGGALFGNSLGFYVVRGDTGFMKAEDAFDTIKEDIGKNVIVLLYDKIDSRLKFGKHFKDEIVTFEKLAPNVLTSYVKKEIQLSDTNIEKLIQICGGSYDRCMLEIDKIKQFRDGYAKDKQEQLPYDGAFLRLLNCGVIYQPEETDVFKFVEAVCTKQVRTSLIIEEQLRADNVSSINILGTLYNSMRAVMLIQCCRKGENISEVTGLEKGPIYFNSKYKGNYPTPKLLEIMQLISRTISGVKSGWIEDNYATRFVLSNIL